MAHEISIANGIAEMVSGRGMRPWHGLGTIVQGLMTAKEALSLAHLDWGVISMPVSCNGAQLPFPNGNETRDCWQGICRADIGSCLGIVRGRYTPIQNSEAFQFFDNLIGQGAACYDTAGALRDGKQVWLLAKIDGEIQIAGDEHRQYALMLTSHDGSYALQVSWVLERVVCANTLSIALRDATNTVKIRHTEGWRNAEQEAARVLGLGEHYFEAIGEQLQSLTAQLLTPDQMADFAKLLVPAKDENDVPTRTRNIRAEITSLFQAGDGNHGQTRFDALQAVSDYADHGASLRGPNANRLESSLLGSAADLKQRAFDTLTSDELMDGILAKRPFVPAPIATSTNPFVDLLSR